MTYITIDTRKKQAASFLEFVKTLPFVTIHEEEMPNETTIQAIEDARQGKGKRHKNLKEFIEYLKR